MDSNIPLEILNLTVHSVENHKDKVLTFKNKKQETRVYAFFSERSEQTRVNFSSNYK